MATVRACELAWPDHLTRQGAMVAAVAERDQGLLHLDGGVRVMRNTKVTTRQMIQSLDETLAEQEFGQIISAGQPLRLLRETGPW
jgi:hypothetical protein